MTVEHATTLINAAHTIPVTAGKVLSLVKPRVGALWHTLLFPPVAGAVFADLRKVYDGPVVQTQDLTVFNVTQEAVVVRQAQVMPQQAPVAGDPTIKPTIGERPETPAWWAEAILPVEDVLSR